MFIRPQRTYTTPLPPSIQIPSSFELSSLSCFAREVAFLGRRRLLRSGRALPWCPLRGGTSQIPAQKQEFRKIEYPMIPQSSSSSLPAESARSPLTLATVHQS